MSARSSISDRIRLARDMRNDTTFYHHQLKAWPRYFIPVCQGVKRFEIRINDRDFKVGQRIKLAEWDPGLLPDNDSDLAYTGRYCFVDVLYLTDFEQKPGWVVMSIDLVPRLGYHPL